jgi:predicted O-methyltransferase YrrM
MEIVHREIERYIRETEARSHPVQREMEEYAEEQDFPIIGPRVGRLLSILARSSGARQVLELGSGFAYSAFWFARALPEAGRVLCTELAEENRDRGMAYLRKAGLAEKVEYRLGDGLAVARELAESRPESFDILFNDIDKEWYAEVPALAKRLLRHGGLFITDNTLWGGTVVREGQPADERGAVSPDTAGVLELNRLTVQDPEFETSILPIRDGLTLAYRV